MPASDVDPAKDRIGECSDLLMHTRRWTPALVLLCIACSASPTINVGNEADGSVAGSGGASGSSGFGGVGGFGGNDNALSAHIEEPPSTMAIEVITVGCSGECKQVIAVATGGNDPYAFAWNDGVTTAAREICADDDTTFTVTVSDTAIVDGEFPYDAQTVTASVIAQVLSCPSDGGVDAGGDAGTFDGVYWATWTEVTLGAPGSATANLQPPGGAIDVTYTGQALSGSAITGQPSTLPVIGTIMFAPESTFTSATVPNGPPPTGMIYLDGSAATMLTIHFSEPVRDPLLAVISLGNFATASTWSLDATPQVLSSGPGALNQNGVLSTSGQRLIGNEGSGVVELLGSYTDIHVHVMGQDGHFLTVGIRGRP